MMAGNHNWWSMNGMHPQLSSQLIYGASNSPNNPSPPDLHHPTPDFPVRSWSQLLLGGGLGAGEEERFGASLFQQQKKIENWEDQVLNMNPSFSRNDVKPQIYDQDQFQANSGWPRQHPVSSPTSCVTTLSFSASAERKKQQQQQHNQEHSSECNSTSTGGVSKKARVQQSSAQPALKVRKEKLGDRITALHQLVSPFGKTDTASVLSEAIGYIRFLQGQIEALSSPYMRNAAGNTVHHQHSLVQERNSLFPEEPSQFLNDSISMEGRGASDQDSQGRSDLRSRGLCLVPISCTQHVGNENGADYWAPAAFGGGF
ncbi:transcription factor bHLH68-like isoform X1 [Salvia splendens]|uniref:transcription factor bHLH68-like isoform X1 n=1 Tax=Salvia splendens TaxID=180675 RepID=UPI001C25716C|nr:transcription factor bHLH68-like isoform X1 [Salvia splendens]